MMKIVTKQSKLRIIGKKQNPDLTNNFYYREFISILNLVTTLEDIVSIGDSVLFDCRVKDYDLDIDAVTLKYFQLAISNENDIEIRKYILECYNVILAIDLTFNTERKRLNSVSKYRSHTIYMSVYDIVGKKLDNIIVNSITEKEVTKCLLLSFINQYYEIGELLIILKCIDDKEHNVGDNFFDNYKGKYGDNLKEILSNRSIYERDIKQAIFKLNILIYSDIYQNHPFVRNVSIKDANLGVQTVATNKWLDILIQAELPMKCLHKFLIFCLSWTIKDCSYTDVTSTDFENKLDETLLNFSNENDFKFRVACSAASANLYDTLKYCIENKWTIITHNNYSYKMTKLFIDHALLSFANDTTIRLITLTMDTLDIWDYNGIRPIHRIIASNLDEIFITGLIQTLIWEGKTSILPCKKDKTDLVIWCEKMKKNLVQALINSFRVSSIILLRARNIVPKWIDNGDIHIEFPCSSICNVYAKLFAKSPFTGDACIIYDIFVISIDNEDSRSFDNLIKCLNEHSIKYFAPVESNKILFFDKYSFLEYEDRITKEKVLEKKHKKEFKKQQKAKLNLANEVEIESNESLSPVIMSVPSGNSREKKIVQDVTKYDVKFTDADRNIAYIKLYEQNHSKLYQLFTPTRIYDKVDNSITPKLTLNDFKYRVMDILKTDYSDEIVYIVFAQQYFDPKTSSSFEKSKCSSYYTSFKSHDNIEIIDDNQLKPIEEKLVELVNPFKLLKNDKNVISKKSDRPISLNLKSAKHEFLFLKGLFIWKDELIKPDNIHDDIFEDCLRLGAIRFYNSVLLYARETRSGSLGYFVENITYDDHEAARIRNILAHNFCSIEEIKADVEHLVFKLGERIIDMCNGIKVGVATISLTKSIFFIMKIKNYDPLIDGSSCRNIIKDKLIRIKKYVCLLESKQFLDKGSILLNSLIKDWELITPTLKIWIHHARAIESCILQIGQLSKGTTKFLNSKIQNYVTLCKEIRNIGYHVNVTNEQDDERNFDPIASDLLVDLIQCVRDLNP